MVFYFILLAAFSLLDWYESVKTSAVRVKRIYIISALFAAGMGVLYYINADAPSFTAMAIDLLGLKTE